jgi:sugar/nucleoside kinase (ribokinase family)
MRLDKSGKIIISGTGCALGDYLYNRISFDSTLFRKYLSRSPGDGGLNPGKLVFTEDLEKFAGTPYNQILDEITQGKEPDAFNAGGPSLVPLIHASQLLGREYEVRFHGLAGTDETSERLFEIIRKTPLNVAHYQLTKNSSTPFTDVFSDPHFEKGMGERSFANNLGAAFEFSPAMLDDAFFESRIACFGGTAIVPKIHDNLTMLLQKAKKSNSITLVNTVYDFRSEKSNPGGQWPLVSDEKHFELIDVLIMDCEEALKISGKDNIDNAVNYFSSTNVSSFFITNGANDVYYYSNGNLFVKSNPSPAPVSDFVVTTLKENPGLKGDTTGCGDNFVGGIVASLAWQLKDQEMGKLDIIDALSWGVASGGFSCFTLGGVYLENREGEKFRKVKEIQEKYMQQLAGNQDVH